jgi:diacylglycerol kinase (ATP)
MRRILLLANSLFEARGKRDLPRILQAFEEAGMNVEIQTSGSHRAAGEKAKQAIEQGVNAIIVCGGDGTVFDALQGIAGSDIPIGILPFGTGNILAQNLKIPNKPIEAARWLLAAKPRSVPLGKVTCCTPEGPKTWFFAMAAGLGNHAAVMRAAEYYKRYRVGRAAYFAAGLEVLCSQPIQCFDLKILTVKGGIIHRRVSEMLALRVAELNLWRPGGGLDFPFLRLASVEADSRWRLAQASFEALFLGAGHRDRPNKENAAAHYEDVLRVECRPIDEVKYRVPIPVEADGEILGSNSATIEMAGLSVNVLSSPETHG